MAKVDSTDLYDKYQFQVLIDDVAFGFMKISAVSAEVPYDEIREGGVNDEVYFARKPKEKADKIILERGACSEFVANEKLILGKKLKKGVTILIMEGKKVKVSLHCDCCMITKWEYDGFDALSSSLMIKKMEIVHNGFKESKP